MTDIILSIFISHFQKKINVAVKSMKLTCFCSLFVQKNEIVVFVEYAYSEVFLKFLQS